MLFFDHPWVFTLLPVPLLLWWLLPGYRVMRPAVRMPLFSDLVKAAGSDVSSGAVVAQRRWWQWVLFWWCWVMLVGALARPVMLENPVTREVPTRDLLLAIDLSGSMETEDADDGAGGAITRLDAVKDVLDEFLRDRQGDRVGLVVFGSAAFVQVPFTSDLDACRQLLDETAVRMAGPKTAFGDAIGLGITMFQRSEVDDRVMIVLTDGNDTGSLVPPHEAAKIASDEGVVVHTIAFGNPEAVGEQAMDEDALRDVADTTGGRYFFAPDQDGLRDVYAEIDKMDVRQVETDSYRPKLSLFYWPVAGMIVAAFGYCVVSLICSNGVIPHRIGLRSAVVVIAVGMVVSGFGLVASWGGSAFHFLRPWWLCGFVVLAWVMWTARASASRPKGLERMIAPHLLQHLMMSNESSGRSRSLLVFGMVMALGLVSLAGPSWRKEPSPFAEDKTGVMVVLKVAPSMMAEDVQPSRLERARHKVHDLLELRSGSRAGLVVFSGSAHLVMPMTSDTRVIDQMLDGLSPEVMPRDGDSLDQALRLADYQIERSGGAGTVVLITDTIGTDGWGGRSPVVVAALPVDDPSFTRQTRAAFDRDPIYFSVDDHDIIEVNRQIETNVAGVLGDGERWRDDGYWLIPLMVVGVAMWSRRGWSLGLDEGGAA